MTILEERYDRDIRANMFLNVNGKNARRGYLE